MRKGGLWRNKGGMVVVYCGSWKIVTLCDDGLRNDVRKEEEVGMVEQKNEADAVLRWWMR